MGNIWKGCNILFLQGHESSRHQAAICVAEETFSIWADSRTNLPENACMKQRDQWPGSAKTSISAITSIYPQSHRNPQVITLTKFVKFWKKISKFRNFWEFLGISGIFWEFLWIFGNSSCKEDDLGISGNFWEFFLQRGRFPPAKRTIWEFPGFFFPAITSIYPQSHRFTRNHIDLPAITSIWKYLQGRRLLQGSRFGDFWSFFVFFMQGSWCHYVLIRHVYPGCRYSCVHQNVDAQTCVPRM